MVVEENLVDRYLLGKMDETEAMAFEDFYAGSTETLEELETSALLIDGLQSAGGGASSATDARVTQLNDKRPPARGRVMRMLASPAYGVAASFVALAAVLVAVSGNLRAPDAGSAPGNAINIPVITMSPTRGAAVDGAQNGIQIIKGEAEMIVFALDVGMAGNQSYTAALHTRDGDLLWRADGLQPDLLDSLTMSISKGTLPEGDYRIIVRTDNNNGDTLTYPFSITR